MTSDVTARIARALDERFGTKIPLAADDAGAHALARMLEHRSHRRYSPRPVSNELLQLLFACAFSAPSKSDLQQADIVHIIDADKRKTIADLIPDNPWVREAPVFLVVCGNNRRTRQVARSWKAICERSPRRVHERCRRCGYCAGEFYTCSRSGGARLLSDKFGAQSRADGQ